MSLLISEDELQQLKGLAPTVQPRHILPFIREAQEQHIRPLLGTALYDELLTQAIQAQLSEANRSLLSYVQQALAYLAYAAYVLRGQFISTAAGLRVKDSDVSSAPAPADAAMLYRMARQDADRYVRQLLHFLHSNKDQYPLWRSVLHVGSRWMGDVLKMSKWVNEQMSKWGAVSIFLASDL